MQVSSSTTTQIHTKPQKPQAPTPPAGGNVENRQPPAEPSPPQKPVSGQDGIGTKIDQKA